MKTFWNMSEVYSKSTTKKRHEKIFKRYLAMLRSEYEIDPKKAICLSKSHFYKELADEFNHAPTFIGRIVQLGLRNMGSPPSRKKRAISVDDMDEQVRFILNL